MSVCVPQVGGKDNPAVDPIIHGLKGVVHHGRRGCSVDVLNVFAGYPSCLNMNRSLIIMSIFQLQNCSLFGNESCQLIEIETLCCKGV